MHSSNKVCFFFQFIATVIISFDAVYLLTFSCGIQMKSLATFQHDANCMALLMDGSAALGLDLSFVTHVYLMEPIWDRR